MAIVSEARAQARAALITCDLACKVAFPNGRASDATFSRARSFRLRASHEVSASTARQTVVPAPESQTRIANPRFSRRAESTRSKSSSIKIPGMFESSTPCRCIADRRAQSRKLRIVLSQQPRSRPKSQRQSRAQSDWRRTGIR